uniref:Uncharacterized protein n=1 Tax=Arundo donax TaxID=35708 RepID=A0A0A9BH76_ARUDO
MSNELLLMYRSCKLAHLCRHMRMNSETSQVPSTTSLSTKILRTLSSLILTISFVTSGVRQMPTSSCRDFICPSARPSGSLTLSPNSRTSFHSLTKDVGNNSSL